MLIARRLVILLLVLAVPRARAIVVETVEEAADELGYQIVGEVEFAPQEAAVPRHQLESNVREATIVCPSLDSRHRRADRAHLVVMAWADREYPNASRYSHEVDHRELAHRRAESVAQAMRRQLAGELSFDLVNMATRSRHDIPLGGRAMKAGTADVKAALVNSGAAPTSSLEMGLFGEYAQASKAVIWIDCDRPPVPQPRAARPGGPRMVEERALLRTSLEI